MKYANLQNPTYHAGNIRIRFNNSLPISCAFRSNIRAIYFSAFFLNLDGIQNPQIRNTKPQNV